MQPTTIGPFQILRELGRGGMGEVYLARDTRLDRQVAIKALPAHLAADPDRLARFQREAKLLASLNHSGIGAIYGLEESGGHQYLILEFIEGQTLADRLGGGAIPVDDSLAYAKQIAEALEVAHEKSIVHRDLKPGNIMITVDGHVKVLDFGLARTDEGSASTISAQAMADSPTVTSPPRMHSPTIPGVIMGTAGYMSPEQARGKSVDKRSDIFSFGCVLFEMLTGTGPFPGETVTDSLGAILHREPDWTLLPPGTPLRIRDLLAGTLAKDRKNRLHDIGDARIEIDRALSGRDSAVVGQKLPNHKGNLAARIVATVTGALALIAATAFITSQAARPRATSARVSRLLIPSQDATYAEASDPVISPDGRFVVFSALGTDRSKRYLWIRPIDSFDARALPETDGAFRPFWSPDSRSIAFFLDGKLCAMDAAQSNARKLIATDAFGGGGATWAPDGSILYSNFGGTTPIMRIPPGGGLPQAITTIDPASTEKGHVFPIVLPDGEHFLYVGVVFDPAVEAKQGRLYAGRIGSTEKVFIANMISRVAYVEPGWLVFVEDGTAKAVPFDARALKITGEAMTLADGVLYFRGYGNTSLSVSNDGTVAYQPPRLDRQLVWFDLTGKRLGTVGPRGGLFDVRLSPDGSQVATSICDRRTGYPDIWLFGTNRPTTVHLTTDAREESRPVWSRDASRIYYSADRSTVPEIVSVRSDGSGPVEKVYNGEGDIYDWYAMDAAPDGKMILVNGSTEKRGMELRVMSTDTPGKAIPFRSTPANETEARFSPDGKWISYGSDESGKQEIYLSPYPERGAKVQISDGGGVNALWSPDGKKIYYVRLPGGDGKDATAATSAIMAVDLDSPETFTSPPKPRMLFEVEDQIDGVDITPDGKRLLMICSPHATPPIHVVMNGLTAATTPAVSTRH